MQILRAARARQAARPGRRLRARRPPYARASPAPTWPTSSTRPRCSPSARAGREIDDDGLRGGGPARRCTARSAAAGCSRPRSASAPRTTRRATRSSPPRRGRGEDVHRVSILAARPRGRRPCAERGRRGVAVHAQRSSRDQLVTHAGRHGRRGARASARLDRRASRTSSTRRDLARDMVARYGMSDELGRVRFLAHGERRVPRRRHPARRHLARDPDGDGRRDPPAGGRGARPRRRRCSRGTARRSTTWPPGSRRRRPSRARSCRRCSRRSRPRWPATGSARPARSRLDPTEPGLAGRRLP